MCLLVIFAGHLTLLLLHVLVPSVTQLNTNNVVRLVIYACTFATLCVQYTILSTCTLIMIYIHIFQVFKLNELFHLLKILNDLCQTVDMHSLLTIVIQHQPMCV